MLSIVNGGPSFSVDVSLDLLFLAKTTTTPSSLFTANHPTVLPYKQRRISSKTLAQLPPQPPPLLFLYNQTYRELLLRLPLAAVAMSSVNAT
jgi:hypothetical protein